MSLDINEPNETHFADVDGTQIAWRSEGQGRPLLMLTRFRASMADWDPELIMGLTMPTCLMSAPMVPTSVV